MRRLSCVVLICVCPLAGAWLRLLQTENGEGTEPVTAHPLRYFTENQQLRADGDGLCRDCKQAQSAGSNTPVGVESELRPIGTLAEFAFLDVLYRPSHAQAAKWKSILMQTGSDQYVEIYHLQTLHTTANAAVSRIVRAGTEQVLATYSSDGGNGGGCWEQYWFVDAQGPHTIDFAPVAAAISRRVSPATFFAGCAALNLERQEVQAPVQKADAACRACGLLGTAVAHFKLRGSHVEVTDVEFHPAKAVRREAH